MVIGIVASVLLGGAVFLLTLRLYPACMNYTQQQTETRLRSLLVEIESTRDRESIKRFTGASPLLTVIVLGVLLLFARSALAVAVSIVAAYLAYKGPNLLQQRLKSMQDKRLVDQLPDVLNAVANSVKAGETLPMAFKAVGNKFDPPARTVFRVMSSRYESGEKFEDTILRMAAALKIESFDYIARAISIHLKQGGQAYDMLNKIRLALIEQDRCDRVMRATTASGRFTMQFLTFCPLFFIPMLSFIQPDWANILLGSFGGVCLTALAVGIYLFALRWAKEILSIEKI